MGNLAIIKKYILCVYVYGCVCAQIIPLVFNTHNHSFSHCHLHTHTHTKTQYSAASFYPCKMSFFKYAFYFCNDRWSFHWLSHKESFISLVDYKNNLTLDFRHVKCLWNMNALCQHLCLLHDNKNDLILRNWTVIITLMLIVC